MNAAIEKLGLNETYEIIANPRFFNRYNINKSPAMIIDGKVVIEGYEPSLAEMIFILTGLVG